MRSTSAIACKVMVPVLPVIECGMRIQRTGLMLARHRSSRQIFKPIRTPRKSRNKELAHRRVEERLIVLTEENSRHVARTDENIAARVHAPKLRHVIALSLNSDETPIVRRRCRLRRRIGLWLWLWLRSGLCRLQ